MSISNGAYQNELEKLPISTGNPVQQLTFPHVLYFVGIEMLNVIEILPTKLRCSIIMELSRKYTHSRLDLVFSLNMRQA